MQLRKDVDKISKGRIQSLMAMTVQATGNDVFREDLTCEFATYSLINHLDAIHSWSGGGGGVDDEGSGSSGDGENDYDDDDENDTDPESGDKNGTAPFANNNNNNSALFHEQRGLNGIEAFVLDYKVGWPLSLIMSKKAITKYQLIFRHLFFCKHVERRLIGTWLDHQLTKECNVRSALGATYCLRQRMLHFVQNFVYYMMFEVINPRWHGLEGNMENVKTVDDVLNHHNDFQDCVLKECLLTNQELLRLLTKLMMCCLLFCGEMNSFTEANNLVEKYNDVATEERVNRMNQDPEGIPKGTGGRKTTSKDSVEFYIARKGRMKAWSEELTIELQKNSYKKMIEKFQKRFDETLGQFMKSLLADKDAQYHSHLSNLCIRLDYNGFWSENDTRRGMNI